VLTSLLEVFPYGLSRAMRVSGGSGSAHIFLRGPCILALGRGWGLAFFFFVVVFGRLVTGEPDDLRL
jgi:hypothetical protein